MEEQEIIQLDGKDIKPIREKLLEEQNGICPLCLTPIDPNDAALDHCHDSGLIRGVLHKRCNSNEGALKSKFRRSGIQNIEGCEITFEEYILNLHFYLTKDHHDMLHPSNKPGPKKLMKSSYNKLVREIKKANEYYKAHNKKPIKIPDYPKSKRLTKRLDELYEEFGIDPRFYN